MPEFDLAKAINIITPVALTIIGNFILWLFIKSKVEAKINEHHISYSGIFKEKITIYRQLLCHMYNINVYQLRYSTGTDSANSTIDLITEVKTFMQYLAVNKAFLSDNVLNQLLQLESAFAKLARLIYTANTLAQNLINSSDPSKESISELDSQVSEIKRLIKSALIDELKKSIFEEMRKDLKTSKAI